MQAFPEDSANMNMRGAPVDKDHHQNQFMGIATSEAFRDYSAGARRGSEAQISGAGAEDLPPRPGTSSRKVSAFNTATLVDPVHGDETMGLGTSTFMEGTPASRAAMQRTMSEEQSTGGGLSRTKSLAQRIKSVKQTRPERFQNNGPQTSEATYGNAVTTSPTSASSTKQNENNPFFTTESDGKGKDGVTFTENETTGRARAPSSPRRPLERQKTSDSFGGNAPDEQKMGLLQRVKSLKGGRRARTDRSQIGTGST
jgi:Pal1 cell morphology protein